MPEPTAATRPASPAAASAPPALPPLPDVVAQAERLVALGVHEIAGLTADAVRAAASDLAATAPAGALLVVDPALAPPSALAPLLRLPAKDGEKEGFVVVDMTDV
ncbi:MAG: DUF5701 family protein, partial [Cellulosimicrobium funkei]